MAQFPYFDFSVFNNADEDELKLIKSCRSVSLTNYNALCDHSVNISLSVMHLNCYSILKKQDITGSLLSSFTVQPDICLFSDTWLHQTSIPPWLPGYSGSHF